MEPIPVICDRCRSLGAAGEADFSALGDLLDFEPVPRRPRVDGWTPEAQRAFIAAVAVTGSPRQACAAVGRALWGFEQLKKAAGNEAFMRAFERAMALAKDEGGRRLAAGVHAVTAPAAHWRPPASPYGRQPPPGARPPFLPAGAEERELSAKEERERIAGLEAVFRHYMQRLEMERRARLSGRICEADFYVRQITVLEIQMQMMSGGHEADALRWLHKIRLGDHKIISIAETTMSRLLDDARRAQWAAMGEPERPGPLPEKEMIDKGGYKVIRSESFDCGKDPYPAAERARDEEYAAYARAQVEWEEKARREAAAWRARLEEAGEDVSDFEPAWPPPSEPSG